MTRIATKRVALIASGVIAAVAISATLVVLLVTIVKRDTRQDINLADFAYARFDDPALYGYANATDDLCRDIGGCIQGYRAGHAAYRKFTTTDAAAVLLHLGGSRWRPVAGFRGRPVVYLDQNQRSTLSKSLFAPRRVPDTERVAAVRLLEMAEAGAVILPMSSAHLTQICKENDPSHVSNSRE